MLKIRLIGTVGKFEPIPCVEFDSDFPIERCDGVLAWGSITEEFLNYRGPRAWYFDEALTHSVFRTPLFKRGLRELRDFEVLHHSNRNPNYRFPCVTYYGPMTTIDNPVARSGIAAVVSNFGGRAWWRKKGARLRNRFIRNPRVQLFGNPESWTRFRRWPWSSPRVPENYRGPHPSDWRMREHVQALSQFEALVCFENEIMPYYFTEKFVNAARAGCVPIYYAHPTVRNTVLKDAIWIDPSDYRFSVEDTIAAACNADHARIRENNFRWLEQDEVKATNGYKVWSRIADLFQKRILGEMQTCFGR